MIDAHQGVRESGGEIEEIVDEPDARVDARHQIMPLQEFEAGAPGAVHEVAAIAEIPDAAHVGVLHVPIEHRLGVGIGQVALRDDAVRITGLVGESLKPLRLVDGVRSAKRRLDVDRLRHIREADLGDIVVDPIVLRLQGVDIAEKSMDGVALEP